MGLFSKKKEETMAPPMPPAPQAPSMGSFGSNLQAPAAELSNLNAPPIPGGSLADIKEQVAFKPSSMSMPSMDSSSMVMPSEVESHDDVEESDINFDDDSLFDFSELELQSPVEGEVEQSAKVVSVADEDSDSDVNMDFINHEKKIKEHDDTYFVTTKQFKSLLEIVDSVKNKVKESSETHLRLLDIKSEEDIEYENLRKDFQFIEEKLYEVDSIIFDK